MPPGDLSRRARSKCHPGFQWLAILCVTFAAACQSVPVSLARGPRQYVATDYAQVLARWTRSGSVISLTELEDMLTATATFESWDFRWAYVIRYANDYRLTIEQRKSLLEKSLQETESNHEFYVALYGSNRRWTDLAKPTSAWVVRLVDDTGNETVPSQIDPIAKPGAIERRYYPYTSPWRQAFRIRFPAKRADGFPTVARNAKWFGLRFAGAEGSQELKWELERAP